MRLRMVARGALSASNISSRATVIITKDGLCMLLDRIWSILHRITESDCNASYALIYLSYRSAEDVCLQKFVSDC